MGHGFDSSCTSPPPPFPGATGPRPRQRRPPEDPTSDGTLLPVRAPCPSSMSHHLGRSPPLSPCSAPLPLVAGAPPGDLVASRPTAGRRRPCHHAGRARGDHVPGVHRGAGWHGLRRLFSDMGRDPSPGLRPKSAYYYSLVSPFFWVSFLD
jgi:hypothetical protein